MYLNVDGEGSLSLEETDDFKRFHISVAPDRLTDLSTTARFQAIAEDAGEEHFWLDADAIVELSGREGDEDWKAAFWTMLEKAEPYGFSDVARRKIKAHLA